MHRKKMQQQSRTKKLGRLDDPRGSSLAKQPRPHERSPILHRNPGEEVMEELAEIRKRKT
jgi:hypothetical protein